MLMHYYKQLVDQNAALMNDLNTLRTYVDAYRGKKLYSTVGASLQFVGSLLVAFGVNLITSKETVPGVMMLLPGVVTQLIGLGFSLRDPK